MTAMEPTCAPWAPVTKSLILSHSVLKINLFGYSVIGRDKPGFCSSLWQREECWGPESPASVLGPGLVILT